MSKPVNDPRESVEYEKFIESMLEICNCDERYRPCDGVMAGGLCDGIEDSDEEDEGDKG